MKKLVAKIKLVAFYLVAFASYSLALGVCMAASLTWFTTKQLVWAISMGFLASAFVYAGMYEAAQLITKTFFHKKLSEIMGTTILEAVSEEFN